MPQQKTEVIYDVDGATQELKKLDKKVRKSGDTAQKSFIDAEKATDQFTGGLGRLSPAAGKATSALSSLGVIGGVAAAGFAAAGLAAVKFAADMFNLPGLIKDTNAELQALKEGNRVAQDFEDAGSAVADAQADFFFTQKREQLAFFQSSLVERQNDLESARVTALEELAIQRAKFAGIERAAQKAFDKQKTLEERLKQRRQDRETAALTTGVRPEAAVGRLTQAAARAAQSGDIDRAEELVSKAEDLSAELGNHAFFANQIKSANNAIDRALQQQVRAAQRASSVQKTRVSSEKDQLAAASERVKTLQQEINQLRASQRLVRPQLRETGIAATQERRAQAGEQAARDLTRAREEIRQLEQAGFTLGDEFRALGRGILDVFSRSGPEAEKLGKELFNIVGQASIARNVFEGTPQGLIRAAEDARVLQREITRIRADPNFPAELADIGERVDSLLETTQRAVERAGVGAGRAGIGPGEEITAGRDRVRQQANVAKLQLLITEEERGFADNANESADALERKLAAARALESLTGQQFLAPEAAPGARVADGQAAGPGTSDIAAARQTEINLNVDITGGVFDGQTLRQLTPVIRREVRKEVSQVRE